MLFSFSIAVCSGCPESCDCYQDWDGSLAANCTRRHLNLLPEYESTVAKFDISYNDIETLKDLWYSSGYLALIEFKADAARIQHLHVGTFNYMNHLTKLFLRYNFIEDLQHGVFEGLERLEELRLEGNRLQEMNARVFTNLKEMVELHLDNNRIKVVHPGTFDGLDSLNILSLANNFIARLEPDTFHGLRRLVDLRLNGNYLRILDQNLFRALENLKYLRLDYNKIEEIASGTFSDLNNLVSLNMNGNFLRSFHDYYIDKMAVVDNRSLPHRLSDLSRLVYLRVSGNLLERLEPVAFKQLTSLKFLDASRNRLNSLHKDTFIHNAVLTELRLSDNPGLRVPKEMPFINVKSLRNLRLSGCRIKNLYERTFECLPNLEDVRLHHNSLQTLKVDTLVGLKNLSQLSLYGNPLQCNCELKETWRWCHNMAVRLVHNKPLCLEPKNIPRQSWGFLESLNCFNDSERSVFKSFHSSVQLFVFAVILLSGAVGTFALLLIFGSYERVLEIPNVFIFSIAVGDFVTVFVFLPMIFLGAFTQVWESRLPLCQMLMFARDLTVGVNVLSVMVLAYHSYTWTILSLQARNCWLTSSSKSAVLYLVAIWIIAATLAFPAFLYATNDFDKCSYGLYLIPRVALIQLLFYTVIPLCFVACVYVITERCVTLRSLNVAGKIDGKKVDTREQLSKIVVSLTFILFVCYAPDFIMRLLLGLAVVNQYSNVTKVFIFFTNSLFYSNTWLNPLAVYYTCSTFKNGFKRIIYCERFRKQSRKPVDSISYASATEQRSSVAEMSIFISD